MSRADYPLLTSSPSVASNWPVARSDSDVDTPRVWLGLAVATAVAIALRFAFVGDQSLGYEEWFTLKSVNHASVGGVWHSIRITESTPPLHYIFTWLWVKLTGNMSVPSLRTVPVLAGSLTVPVAFFATRRFVGTGLALVVAWLCAISPELFDYSIYARSYALLVLVATLSIWALATCPG